MKHRLRILIPAGIVAILVLFSVGVTFAHELNISQKVGEKLVDMNATSVAMGVNVSTKSATKLQTKRLDNSTNLFNRTLTGQSGPTSTETVSATSTTITTSTEGTTSDQIELVGVVESIAADSWKVSGQTFAVNTTTVIASTIVVGDWVKVELYLDQANILTASEIKLISEDEHQAKIEFTGTVEAVSDTSVTVSGHVLAITPQTEIEGILVVGVMVKVEALINSDGTLTATQIEPLDDSEDGEDSHNGECEDDECEDDQGEDGDHQGQCHDDDCENDQGEDGNHQGLCHEDECEGSSYSQHDASHDSQHYDYEHSGGDD